MTTAPLVTLESVDPKSLEAAYVQCAHMFDDIELDGCVNPHDILEIIDLTQPNLEKEEVVELFRRLCLTVQLVSDLDANWDDSGLVGNRPDRLPPALFHLASSEIAFEESDGDYCNSFFAREILDDAFRTLRPS